MSKGLSRNALIAILVICLAGAIAGVAYLVSAGLEIQQTQQRQEQTPTPTAPADVSSSSSAGETTGSASSAAEPELPDNPIDFASLRKKNSDIYAWITVPDTNVNYAVLQNPLDNSFYLSHNEDKEESRSGAVYSELYNTKDFTDPVTMLYGHNGFGDTFFTTLHYYRDQEFFDSHPEFYIYTPGHIYTYTVVSAFIADDRHIFSVYNFSKEDQLLQFEYDITHSGSVYSAVRDGVQLDEKSRFVVLSTCNPVEIGHTGRFLVCGVLSDDTKTK